MNSMISLGIGKMELDWGKHNFIHDHSELFHNSNIKKIPHYYIDENDNIITEMKEGCSSKLSQVKNRLNLLGYDYKSIENKFELEAEELNFSNIDLSFEDYESIIKSIDVANVDTVEIEKEYAYDGFDFGEYVSECILSIPNLKEGLISIIPNEEYYFEIPKLSEFLENLDPYITLRIICENPEYDDYELVWCFDDLISAGYTNKKEIFKGLDPNNKILIVTEGTCDSFILKRTIYELLPDISDFFVFIDMKDNYPFTGTGNLYNFCKGLAKISIQNKVIVIFDNDTEGIEKYNKSNGLDKPETFIIIKLPDFAEFNQFKTIGPQGISTENVNGKAVAIECFLDFKSLKNEPVIRWSSYNYKLCKYQGALEHKDDYVTAFKKANLTDGSYDTSKLERLVKYICDKWINK